MKIKKNILPFKKHQIYKYIACIEFKEKDNKINIWEMVRRLKGFEKQSLIIERKIKNVLHSSCLISNKQ